MKKITSLVVAFCMVAMLGVMAFPAEALAATQRTTTLDVTAMATTTNAAEGWDWNAGTKTLTLSGVDIDAQTPLATTALKGSPMTVMCGILVPSGSTMVIAAGSTNTVKVEDTTAAPEGSYGIATAMGGAGSVTITNNVGGASGILNINSGSNMSGGSSASSFGIWGYDGNNGGDDLIINGGTINVTTGDATRNSNAIFVGANLAIKSGVIDATGGNGPNQAIGIGAGQSITIGQGSTPDASDPIVNATAGNGGRRSIGVWAPTLAFNNGTTTATSATSGAGYLSSAFLASDFDAVSVTRFNNATSMYIQSPSGGILKRAEEGGAPTSYASQAVFDSTGTTMQTKAVIAAPVTYTVTYNGNGSTGGTVPNDANTYAEGAKVTVLGNTGRLTKGRDAFLGWSQDKNATAPDYSAGVQFDMPAQNTILFAIWGAVPAPPTVTNATGITWGTEAIFGKSEPGAKITVTLPDGTVMPSVTADASGNWVVKDVPMSYPGTVSIVASNANGDSAPALFSVGQVPMMASLSLNPVKVGDKTVSGAADPFSMVFVTFFDKDGYIIDMAIVFADSSGNWIATIPDDVTLKKGNTVDAYVYVSDATGLILYGDKSQTIAAGPVAPARITVKTNVDGTVASYTFDTGATVAKLGFASKSGYAFKGWSLHKGGSVLRASTKLVDGTTYYAVFVKKLPLGLPKTTDATTIPAISIVALLVAGATVFAVLRRRREGEL